MPATAAPKPAASPASAKARLLQIVKRKSLLKGAFKLVSGETSNYYLDMKPTTFDPEGAALIADLLFAMLKDEPDVDAVGGLELGAVPIVAALCARSWPERPLAGFVVRKERKDHGTAKKIDGSLPPNATVVLVEDVTTKGGSVMQAVRAAREQGATVKKIITLVDRLAGATENLAREGLPLEALFTSDDLLAD